MKRIERNNGIALGERSDLFARRSACNRRLARDITNGENRIDAARAIAACALVLTRHHATPR